MASLGRGHTRDFFAWLAAIAIGLGLLSVAETLCPLEDVISESCAAAWFTLVSDLIFIVSGACAAGLIVVSSSLMVPAYKCHVAFIVYALRAAYAIYLAWAVESVKELITALIAGLAATIWVRRRELRRARESS